MIEKRVPVTLLTGFLGSGKTTLMNHIINDSSHGMRFAIIENEVGAIAIDDKILSSKANPEIKEVMNGCICCNVNNGQLIDALKRLYKKVENFDGIIIETTGLADPGPVIQAFFPETNGNDELIERMYKLDGIITVADSKHIVTRLEDKKDPGIVNEAEQQICYADKIVLNKIDLVDSEAEIRFIEHRLRMLNPQAPILRCQQSQISPTEILNLGAFDLERVLHFDPYFLGDIKNPVHDRAVSSTSCRVEGDVNLQALENWVGRLLEDDGENLYRYKGIISVKDSEEKFIFQGVGRLFSGRFQGQWGPNERRNSTFVFIGKDLDIDILKAGFLACRQSDELRFSIGTIVEANVGSYEAGVIVAQWEGGNAYRIELVGPRYRGRQVHAPVDIDPYVRLPVRRKHPRR